jgi:hypothetical protein
MVCGRDGKLHVPESDPVPRTEIRASTSVRSLATARPVMRSRQRAMMCWTTQGSGGRRSHQMAKRSVCEAAGNAGHLDCECRAGGGEQMLARIA